jgi:ATP-dependent Clp protease ATP-binding subunit ClpC
MLLQIMEEGQLSDARGHKVDFRNAIIVMTSNVGADVIKRQTSLGFAFNRDEDVEEQQAYDEMRKKLIVSLKRVFRPEFINRVDSVIVFRSLNKEDISEIVELELNKVANRLHEHSITLEATPAALEKLAEMGYDPDMGARPLRRVIQQEIEDALSDSLLGGEFENCTMISVDVKDDKIILVRGEEICDDDEADAAAEEEPTEALAAG